MAEIIGGAIVGSLASSMYEKVDHHLYNKVNNKLGFDLFEVEEENKKKSDIKETNKSEINIIPIKKNEQINEIYVLHFISIISVTIFITYGAYKLIESIKK